MPAKLWPINLWLSIISFLIESVICISPPIPLFCIFNFEKISFGKIYRPITAFKEGARFFLGFSILLGVIFLFISLLSITRLFYYRHPLLMPFCISFLLLINTELFISFAHYRYMLLLIPIIIRGLSFERKEEISLSNKKIYNQSINEILI